MLSWIFRPVRCRLGSRDIGSFRASRVVLFCALALADRRMLRLIQKWLKAGVSEDGQWSETKQSPPQGAVLSPLHANM